MTDKKIVFFFHGNFFNLIFLLEKNTKFRYLLRIKNIFNIVFFNFGVTLNNYKACF